MELCRTLVKSGDARVYRAFIQSDLLPNLLQDTDMWVRYSVLKWLEAIDAEALQLRPDLPDLLVPLLRDTNLWARYSAVKGLGALGPAVVVARPDLLDLLSGLLEDPADTVRQASRETLDVLRS